MNDIDVVELSDVSVGDVIYKAEDFAMARIYEIREDLFRLIPCKKLYGTFVYNHGNTVRNGYGSLMRFTLIDGRYVVDNVGNPWKRVCNESR